MEVYFENNFDPVLDIGLILLERGRELRDFFMVDWEELIINWEEL